MAPGDGDRSRHFPAIEKKHGKPVEHWLGLIAELGDARYPEQMEFLQEQHGFSRAHANALVMYSRGSVTSRRHASPGAFFATLTPAAAVTAKAIFAAITKTHPDLDLVIAWNQPILRSEHGYVLGLSASKNHLTVNPFSAAVLDSCRPALAGLKVNKNTFVVPFDWPVDGALLRRLVAARLAELT